MNFQFGSVCCYAVVVWIARILFLSLFFLSIPHTFEYFSAREYLLHSFSSIILTRNQSNNDKVKYQNSFLCFLSVAFSVLFAKSESILMQNEDDSVKLTKMNIFFPKLRCNAHVFPKHNIQKEKIRFQHQFLVVVLHLHILTVEWVRLSSI